MHIVLIRFSYSTNVSAIPKPYILEYGKSHQYNVSVLTKTDAVKLPATELLPVTNEEAKCAKFKSQHKYVKQYVSASKLFETTALYILHSDCKYTGG
jgi:hypothetical protein